MIIKRNISFFLQKVYNSGDDAESQIRMRVRWNGNVLQFNCGFTIAPSKWNTDISRCKKNNICHFYRLSRIYLSVSNAHRNFAIV